MLSVYFAFRWWFHAIPRLFSISNTSQCECPIFREKPSFFLSFFFFIFRPWINCFVIISDCISHYYVKLIRNLAIEKKLFITISSDSSHHYCDLAIKNYLHISLPAKKRLLLSRCRGCFDSIFFNRFANFDHNLLNLRKEGIHGNICQVFWISKCDKHLDSCENG